MKPRIRFFGPYWRCANETCFGTGLTPTHAYQNWSRKLVEIRIQQAWRIMWPELQRKFLSSNSRTFDRRF